jgi:hypothetical protein
MRATLQFSGDCEYWKVCTCVGVIGTLRSTSATCKTGLAAVVFQRINSFRLYRTETQTFVLVWDIERARMAHATAPALTTTVTRPVNLRGSRQMSGKASHAAVKSGSSAPRVVCWHTYR